MLHSLNKECQIVVVSYGLYNSEPACKNNSLQHANCIQHCLNFALLPYLHNFSESDAKIMQRVQ